MAFEQKIDRLVDRLADLTRQGKVDWTETGSVDTFLAPVSHYTVTIGKRSYYELKVYDRLGRILETATGDEKPETALPSPQERLRELHELARHRALAVDGSLSELLTSLEQIS